MEFSETHLEELGNYGSFSLFLIRDCVLWNSTFSPFFSLKWVQKIKFNVNGVGSVGADGFAFWLAREVNILGNFFGYQERFTGIGVVIDTYDNDGTGSILSF